MSKIKLNTITIKDTVSIHNLACFKRSKDGLFMTYKEELVVYDKAIYYVKYFNGSDDTATLYDLKENGKTLYSIFSKNNLI